MIPQHIGSALLCRAHTRFPFYVHIHETSESDRYSKVLINHWILYKTFHKIKYLSTWQTLCLHNSVFGIQHLMFFHLKLYLGLKWISSTWLSFCLVKLHPDEWMDSIQKKATTLIIRNRVCIPLQQASLPSFVILLMLNYPDKVRYYHTYY